MDLDRSLSQVADAYRPDRQPSLDDLVARARARRRTAVLLSAASVLLLAVGVAVAVPRSDRPSTRVLSTPTLSTTSRPAGCDLKGSGGVIDYIDFVYVGDRSMDAWMGTRETQPVVRDADLGEVVTHVTCRLEDHYLGQQAKELKDGYASFLAVGEPVYAVHGYDPRCRVAARMNGELHVYLAADPAAKVHRNAACSLMPGLDPDAGANQPGDLSTVPPSFANTAQLPDCGSIDTRKDGSLDAGGIAARNCLLHALATRGRAQLRMVYRTVESPRLFEVFGVYGGRVTVYKAGADAFGGHARPEWSEQVCDGVTEDLRGVGCRSTKV